MRGRGRYVMGGGGRVGADVGLRHADRPTPTVSLN